MSNRHVPKVTRRSFLAASAGLAVSGLGLPRASHAREPRGLASIIDLTLCDGCPDKDVPAYVAACRNLYQKTVLMPDIGVYVEADYCTIPVFKRTESGQSPVTVSPIWSGHTAGYHRCDRS